MTHGPAMAISWTAGPPVALPVLHDWNAFVAGLMARCGTAGFFPAVERGLRRWLSFDAFFVFCYDARGEATPVFHNLSGRRKQIIVDDYVDGQYVRDPFYLRLHDRRPATAGIMRLEAIRAGRDCQRYYHLHYRHTGIRDEIGFAAELPGGDKIVASITRPQGTPGFCPEEAAFCAAIEPMMAILLARHAQGPAVETPPPAGADRLAGLGISPREAEVVALILEGHANAAIALRLGITAGTVKIHRKNIYRKLGISNQGELFARAFAGRPGADR